MSISKKNSILESYTHQHKCVSFEELILVKKLSDTDGIHVRPLPRNGGRYQVANPMSVAITKFTDRIIRSSLVFHNVRHSLSRKEPSLHDGIS